MNDLPSDPWAQRLSHLANVSWGTLAMIAVTVLVSFLVWNDYHDDKAERERWNELLTLERQENASLRELLRRIGDR